MKREEKEMEKQNNAIVITAIISGVILIVALVALFSFNLTSSYSENSVNVEGVATVKAVPDLVTVYFQAESNGSTAKEAKDLNILITDQLISNLVALGFEREKIVTQGFNVYEEYDWTDKGRIPKGFKATHSIKIELSLDEMDQVGEVVDAGVDAGAMISYINFELTQESQNKYKAEAMKLAAEDSKIKAEAIAEGFDKKVGKLVNVQVNNFGYYPWNVYSSREGMDFAEEAIVVKEVALNIQPGEEEISATVSATFKLK